MRVNEVVPVEECVESPLISVKNAERDKLRQGRPHPVLEGCCPAGFRCFPTKTVDV